MKILRSSPSMERRLCVVAAGLCLVWVVCGAFSASADEVEGLVVEVSMEPPCADSVKVEGGRSTKVAIVGPNVDWENQRQIPITSPFVVGTGYWGPSLHSDAD